MPFQSLSLSFAEDHPADLPRRVGRGDVDAAFQGWQHAANKSQFMSALDLPTAQSLMEHILREAPITSARRKPDTFVKRET